MTWEQRLQRARKAGKFSVHDKKMVGEWPTCAIGERFHLKNRTLVGARVNTLAEQLGLDFMYAVKGDQIYEAVQLYDNIQTVQR